MSDKPLKGWLGRRIALSEEQTPRMQSSYIQRLWKYLWLLGWLMRDFIWRYRWRAGRLLTLRLGGMFLQLSTFGLLAQYARMLETDATVTPPWGDSIDARTSVELLMAVGAASLVAMMAGALMILISTRRIESLCADYEEYCGKRILDIAGRSSRLDRPPLVDGDDDQLILRLCKQYPRLMRRMTKVMLTSLLPSVLVVAVVFPVLFTLNFWLTLLVLILVLGSLAAQYRLNVRAAQSSVLFERTARESLHEFRNVLGRLHRQIDPLDREDVERPFSAKPFRQNQNAYFTRVTATTDSQFITDCSAAIILVIVLVTLGGSILRDGGGWAFLLIYLLALRYSMSQLKSTLTSFTNIARFFHQIRAYFLFIYADHEPIELQQGSTIQCLKIQCTSDQRLPGSLDAITLRGGDCFAVYGPFKPTRFQLRALYGVLFAEQDDVVRDAISVSVLIADESDLAKYWSPVQQARGEQRVRPASLGETETRPLRIAVIDEKAMALLQSGGDGGDEDEQSGGGLSLPDNRVCILLAAKASRTNRCPAKMAAVVDEECVCWLGKPDALPSIAYQTGAGAQPGGLVDEGVEPAFDDSL